MAVLWGRGEDLFPNGGQIADNIYLIFAQLCYSSCRSPGANFMDGWEKLNLLRPTTHASELETCSGFRPPASPRMRSPPLNLNPHHSSPRSWPIVAIRDCRKPDSKVQISDQLIGIRIHTSGSSYVFTFVRK